MGINQAVRVWLWTDAQLEFSTTVLQQVVTMLQLLHVTMDLLEMREIPPLPILVVTPY